MVWPPSVFTSLTVPLALCDGYFRRTHAHSHVRTHVHTQLHGRTAARTHKDENEPVPEIPGGPYPIADEIVVTEKGVHKLLSRLNTAKASGPDGIPNHILKELAPELSRVLTPLFNQTLSTGQLPDDWKRANVSPIFKKDDKHLASNYRPVSLTCVCSKLMEHIIVSNMMKHLDTHHILSDLQHGFRQRRSCTTQLLITVSQLAKFYDENVQVDINVLVY